MILDVFPSPKSHIFVLTQKNSIFSCYFWEHASYITLCFKCKGRFPLLLYFWDNSSYCSTSPKSTGSSPLQCEITFLEFSQELKWLTAKLQHISCNTCAGHGILKIIFILWGVYMKSWVFSPLSRAFGLREKQRWFPTCPLSPWTHRTLQMRLLMALTEFGCQNPIPSPESWPHHQGASEGCWEPWERELKMMDGRFMNHIPVFLT